MNSIVRRVDSHFFFLSLIYFVLGAVVLILIDKGDAVLFFNRLHTPFLDQFFKYATHLGGGWFLVFIFLLLLFFTPLYKVCVACVSFSLMGIFSQLLKRQVFPNHGRPKEMFWAEIDLMNLVEGVKVNTDFSFPSGHTAAAFILALVLVWSLNKKPWVSYVLFGLALVVGISRIYLFQHFFIDTYFGTWLSFLIGYGVIWYFERGGWMKGKLAKKRVFFP